MTCAKCNPGVKPDRFRLCARCFNGWGKGKWLEEYLDKSVLPDPPKPVKAPHHFRGNS